MKEYVQIFTTTGRREDAERIAQVLMQKRLAGCVQIIANVSSTYWWKGKIEKAEEWLCLIKSEKTLYEQIEKVIKEIHPYEVPENTLYLSWREAKNTSDGLIRNSDDQRCACLERVEFLSRRLSALQSAESLVLGPARYISEKQ